MMKLLWFGINVVVIVGYDYYDFDRPSRYGDVHRRYIDSYTDDFYKGQKYIYPKSSISYRNSHFDRNNEGDEIKFNSDVFSKFDNFLTHRDDFMNSSDPENHRKSKMKKIKNHHRNAGDKVLRNNWNNSLTMKINDILKIYFSKLQKKLNEPGATWENTKEEMLDDSLELEGEIETLSESSETTISENLYNAIEDAKVSVNSSRSKLLDPNKLWMIKNSTQFLAKKFLSLFTIVKFPNTACNASNGFYVYEGTCLYESECQARNGTAMGVCADGYGVCCVFILSCGGISNYNCTYFQSPGYPMTYPPNGVLLPVTVSPISQDTINPRLRYHFLTFMARQENTGNSLHCSFSFNKISNAVRQFRIDFLDFELLGPTSGTCVQEKFVISGQNRQNIVPPICGYNTGSHIYVDVTDVTGPINFAVMSTVVQSKRFRIKICQITECLNSLNCLQYYTGIAGVISSFNYDQASSMSRSTPGYFNDLNYAICIRKEAGYCSITYTTRIEGGVDYPFHLVNLDFINGYSTVEENEAGADAITCHQDYIVINGIRLCGMRLNDGTVNPDFTVSAPVTDNNTGPFIVLFRTDPTTVARGFKLRYMQNRCT